MLSEKTTTKEKVESRWKCRWMLTPKIPPNNKGFHEPRSFLQGKEGPEIIASILIFVVYPEASPFPKVKPCSKSTTRSDFVTNQQPKGGQHVPKKTVLTSLVAQDSQLLVPNQVLFGIPYPIGIHGTGIVTYISPCSCGHFSPFM